MRAVARLVPSALFVAFALAVLELATRVSAVNPAIVPPPTTVLHTVAGIVASGSFVRPLALTFGQLAAGYAVGCGLAVVLGVLMGSFRVLYELFEPLTELLRPIPKPALLPALMLFLGLGAPMKISIVALAAFFPVLVTTLQGTRAVDPVLIDMARTFGHGRWGILAKIVLPATLPYVLAGMRVSLGIAMVVMVAAEMIAGNGGIGYVLRAAQEQFSVNETYGWLVVLAVWGLALNGGFVWIERRLLFWHLQTTN